MSVIELPPTDVLREAAAEAPPRGSHDLRDAQFTQLFIRGGLFGTPVLYVILAGVSWLAAPGHLGLFVAVLWPALFAGWYFGGIVALTVLELRQERMQRGPQAATSPKKRFAAPTRPPVPVH